MNPRWPPVYDADSLADTIEALVSSNQIATSFYSDEPKDVAHCQGDVLTLDIPIVVMGDDGRWKRLELPDRKHAGWLIATNTCDLAREPQSLSDETTWTTLIPIFDWGRVDGVGKGIETLRNYRGSRRFYLPPWDNADESRVLVANLAINVTVHRGVLAKSTLLARMSSYAWFLFNSCLVRYLARDDGRFDP